MLASESEFELPSSEIKIAPDRPVHASSGTLRSSLFRTMELGRPVREPQPADTTASLGATASRKALLVDPALP